MSRLVRRAKWLRRRGRDLRALIGLVRAVRGGARAELWLGDSHTVYFNGLTLGDALRRAPDGQYVWHLGARLMHSLGTKGFPPMVWRAAPLLRWAAQRGSLVVVFVAGEIDIRCHLVGRSADLAFVEAYVDRALEVARGIGADRAVFVSPPPSSSTCPVVPEFPIRGTLEERLEVFHRLRAVLADSVARVEGSIPATYLDVTEALTEAAGGLDVRYTDDGCHTNALGAAAVRAQVRGLDLLSA